MFNQKGFSKIVLIIVALILIGGSYFVFSKKDKNIPAQNIENKSSQSSQSIGGDLSTKDWLTYRNDKYGFKFKYPSQILTPSDLGRAPNSDLLYEFKENDWVGNKSIWSGGADTIARLDLIFPEKDGKKNAPFPKGVNLGIISGDTEKILEGWKIYFKKDYNLKNIKVSNLDATQISSKPKDEEVCLDGCPIVFTIVYKKPYNYIFEVGFSRTLVDDGDYMVKIYNQIISTFEFTK